MPVSHIQSETGDIVWDDRYAPFFFGHNRGTWTHWQIEEWYKRRNVAFLKSIEAGHKVFFIGDISNTTTPTAVTRKFISDLQAEYDQPFMGNETWIGQCWLISNPIMRGLITAVNWMTGGMASPPSTASSLSAALQIAERAYGKYDLELPYLPADYVLPDFEGTLPRTSHQVVER